MIGADAVHPLGVATGLDSFAAIDLAELSDRAPLLTRIDRKYPIPAVDVPALLESSADIARILDIGGRRQFRYRSAYFDSVNFECYLAAARRRGHRYKLRIRSYLDSDQHFLEVKVRGARGMTVKDRMPYGLSSETFRSDCAQLLAAAGVSSDGGGLWPALTTHYVRTTLFIPASASRVTIDTALTWSLPDGTSLCRPELAIVETKNARAYSAIDRMLWSAGHRPRAVSKYATGLAALRPELPSNRWRRVLNHHFATTSPAKDLGRETNGKAVHPGDDGCGRHDPCRVHRFGRGVQPR